MWSHQAASAAKGSPGRCLISFSRTGSDLGQRNPLGRHPQPQPAERLGWLSQPSPCSTSGGEGDESQPQQLLHPPGLRCLKMSLLFASLKASIFLTKRQFHALKQSTKAWKHDSSLLLLLGCLKNRAMWCALDWSEELTLGSGKCSSRLSKRALLSASMKRYSFHGDASIYTRPAFGTGRREIAPWSGHLWHIELSPSWVME